MLKLIAICSLIAILIAAFDYMLSGCPTTGDDSDGDGPIGVD